MYEHDTHGTCKDVILLSEKRPFCGVLRTTAVPTLGQALLQVSGLVAGAANAAWHLARIILTKVPVRYDMIPIPGTRYAIIMCPRHSCEYSSQ